LKESVHLEDWPKVNEKLIDQKVLDYMAITRQVVELGLAKRAEVKIKIRQPLSELRVTGYELQKDYLDLIKDELNVKNIACKKGSGELSVELDTNLTDDLKAEGILRELTRTINGLRKDAGLTIDDFIKLEYNTIDEQISRVFEKYSVELKKAVLAKEISQSDESLEKVKINDSEVGLKITKV